MVKVINLFIKKIIIKKYIVLSFLLLLMNSYGQCLDMGCEVINLDRITLNENHCESEGAIKLETSICIDDPLVTLTMNEKFIRSLTLPQVDIV